MLTQRDWQDAIQVQDACNLSGVVHSLAEVMTRVWDDVHTHHGGTHAVNTHPLVVLYLDKLWDLAGRPDFSDYQQAMRHAKGERKRLA
jgi:hypothetical protein